MARIAIVGSGISGLGSAWLLHKDHDITVYEQAAEIGGHTRTRIINYNGARLAVDTGFIVFNYRNYPNLSALFKYLDVPVQKSNMTFGITINDGAIEWGAHNLNAVFGQRSNLVNPKFLRLTLDILRFNATASKTAEANPALTLGQLLTKLKMSDWFAKYYILPMGGAIWSCSLSDMLGFPALAFTRFFKAHGLLTVTQQPQWYTVTGGSQEYLKRLVTPFKDSIKTGRGVVDVQRESGKVRVKDSTGEVMEYDHVILACHADQALAMLSDATQDERSLLGAFTYQRNTAFLHKDESLMPKRRLCWSSWIYHADDSIQRDNIAVTYWMNQLQDIPEATPVFVTLNPLKPIPQEHVFDEHVFTHPVYSEAAVEAQGKLSFIQGKQNTWFAGAHWRNGFHEDGFSSGLAVAKALGAEVPWH